MVGQEVVVEEHVLESWVVGGVLAGTDVEDDQQRASPTGSGSQPSLYLTFHISLFWVFVKIDCRTIGLREVKWEYNDLGKNSHFLGKVCFCFQCLFWGGKKQGGKFSPIVIMLSL